MKKNVGTTDKIVRIVLAALIAVLYFTNVVTGILGIILLVVATILLVTALLNTCPAYFLMGYTTCPLKEAKEQDK